MRKKTNKVRYLSSSLVIAICFGVTVSHISPVDGQTVMMSSASNQEGFSLNLFLNKINQKMPWYRHINEFKDYEVPNSPHENETDIILKIINDNNNLTDEEKEYFSSYTDFYDEKSKYFNMETLIPSLKELDIEYLKEDNPEVSGSYNKNTKVIKIYESEKFDEELSNVLFHEFIHTLTIPNEISDTNAFLYEGMTEAENMKYNNLDYGSYRLLRNYIMELRFLVGERVINNYFYGNDMDLIITELAKIAGDEAEAKAFLDLMISHYHAISENNALDAFELNTAVTTMLNVYKQAK